ncbi:MAG: OmpA family protein [Crocinitomicaceae bacterium]|nr:MAG: OmpA family protein [Crocinitomicaceae bacterium]
MNCVTNNLKKFSSIVLIGLSTVSSFAQEGENLVPNGSFEATDGKVKKLGGIESATGWTSPTGARADLFTPSKVPDINTPNNLYGKEEAKEGTNYAGIVGYSFGNKVPRSYLMVKLDAPLKKGMKYCVKFNVSLAEGSKYASNNIGANLSKKPFATEEKTIIKDVAHVLHPENDMKKFNQMFSWDQVCGTFTAEGGEKYLTIGNFYADDKTKQENNKKPKDVKVDQVIAAYYYIDNVSIVMLNDGEKCDCIVAEDNSEFSTTIYQKAVILNDKMTVNQKIDKQQVFFAFGKTSLTPSGKESLDFIAEQLKANPTMKIEVQGYSDPEEDKVGVEKPQYAEMSRKRVDAVTVYLTEKGIDASRIIGVDKGSENPNDEISDSDDEDLKMAKNRRVFFRAI